VSENRNDQVPRPPARTWPLAGASCEITTVPVVTSPWTSRYVSEKVPEIPRWARLTKASIAACETTGPEVGEDAPPANAFAGTIANTPKATMLQTTLARRTVMIFSRSMPD
jgi:hypothetical protein